MGIETGFNTRFSTSCELHFKLSLDSPPARAMWRSAGMGGPVTLVSMASSHRAVTHSSAVDSLGSVVRRASIGRCRLGSLKLVSLGGKAMDVVADTPAVLARFLAAAFGCRTG